VEERIKIPGMEKSLLKVIQKNPQVNTVIYFSDTKVLFDWLVTFLWFIRNFVYPLNAQLISDTWFYLAVNVLSQDSALFYFRFMFHCVFIYVINEKYAVKPTNPSLLVWENLFVQSSQNFTYTTLALFLKNL